MKCARLLLPLVLVAGGCGDATGPDAPNPVHRVEVTPSAWTLAAGDTLQLTATPRAGTGAALTGRTVTWTSDDEAVARVGAGGVVHAIEAGTATITASVQGKQGSAALTVTARPGEVARVELSTAAAALLEGEELQLAATARDAQGNALAGLGIQWSSDDPSVTAVSPLGRVSAIRGGTANVTARVHGREAVAAITVSADYPYDLIYTVQSSDVFHEVFRLDLRQAGSSPARLFPAGSRASQPRPSPTGDRIAFVCPHPLLGDLSLCVAGRDGSGARVIAWRVGETFTEPTWSPDGTRLAYVRRGAQEGTGAFLSHIEVVNADGSEPRVLTRGMGGNQYTPAWSPRLPDGTERIAFAHDEAGTNGRFRIWSMRPDGTDQRPLTTAAGALDVQPAWSPDGRTLVFQRTNVGIYGDLWLVDAGGGNERPLTPPLTGLQSSPVWSPDGRLVAFASSHESYGTDARVSQVYTVWADGSKLARRTASSSGAFSPQWLTR
jgi:Tol biopolymer transport system component